MATSKLSIYKLCSIGIAIFTIFLSQTTVISADTTKSTAPIQSTSSYTIQGDSFPERVYNEVQKTMTPIVLENGLTIQFDQVQNDIDLRDMGGQDTEKAPTITWYANKVWMLANDFPKQNDSDPITLSFTQTKKGDTLFACSVQSRTEDHDSKVVLLGIHSTGKVFLHNIWSGSAYTIRFIGTDSWEVAQYLGDSNDRTSTESTCLNWSVDKYTLTSAFDMQKVDTYRQVQKRVWLRGQQTLDTRADWYNPWGDHVLKEKVDQPMETGKPINNVEEARNLLLYIIAAEGLQTTSVTYTNTDHYGNYYFDVWYANFPHNIREVTKDGYVIEDEDIGDTRILNQDQYYDSKVNPVRCR